MAPFPLKITETECIGISGDKHLRIALCIWMFKPGTGGLQAHAENLAKHLRLLGHEVVVLTRAYTCVPEGLGFLTYQEEETEGVVGGIPVRAIYYRKAMGRWAKAIAKLRNFPVIWRLGVGLFRILARSTRKDFAGFDLIHYVGQADQLLGFAAADAAAFHGVPFLVQPTCHPFVVGDSPMDVLLYKKAKRALVHTQYEEEHLRPMMPEVPIDVVGNGIEDRRDGDGARFREQHGVSSPMILYIGRREWDKGYPLVVDAFKLLRKVKEEVVLVCIGPPGEIPMDESPRVINLEFVTEQVKHDALAACTCLCVPSEGESFGLVYMEAGRYSKPVVARRLPVLEELLRNGQAGLLVGNLDLSQNRNILSPGELMNALELILDDPQLTLDLGSECFRVSEEFIWPNIVRRFEQSFTNALY